MSRSLTYNNNNGVPPDDYRENYGSLNRMIFITYALSTNDNYPDNQFYAGRMAMSNWAFFDAFIFLNMLIFAAIPGSLVYESYRETMSKMILIDDIKQENSLILAFVSLSNNNRNLPIETLIQFMLFTYKYKIRYIEYITDICLKLDENNNRSIVKTFITFSKCWSSCN